MTVEIFYGADIPEQRRGEKTEYYQLGIMFVSEDWFVVLQRHGWWDDESSRSRCDKTVLGTVDTELEAKRIYEEQRADLIRRGFVAAASGLWTIPAPAAARGLVEV